MIHHSADTTRILKEMHRVLRAGGQAVQNLNLMMGWPEAEGLR